MMMMMMMMVMMMNLKLIHLRDVVGSVPAFQPGGPGSIPGMVRICHFSPGTGFVFAGGPDIVLTTYSVTPAFVFWSQSVDSSTGI